MATRKKKSAAKGSASKSAAKPKAAKRPVKAKTGAAKAKKSAVKAKTGAAKAKKSAVKAKKGAAKAKKSAVKAKKSAVKAKKGAGARSGAAAKAAPRKKAGARKAAGASAASGRRAATNGAAPGVIEPARPGREPRAPQPMQRREAPAPGGAPTEGPPRRRRPTTLPPGHEVLPPQPVTPVPVATEVALEAVKAALRAGEQFPVRTDDVASLLHAVLHAGNVEVVAAAAQQAARALLDADDAAQEVQRAVDERIAQVYASAAQALDDKAEEA